MKRHAGLFDRITDFDNLLAAGQAAYRGKRLRSEPARFHYHLEPNLLQLRRELLAGTYQPGAYRSFWIHDPKRRLISAAPFRDRVVHHALCRVIEPIFDRTFIFDSYANRQGKGTHRALERATHACRRFGYALKADVEKFFPSIDHCVLFSLLSRKLKCRRTLDLLARIIANSNAQEPAARYFPGDDLFAPQRRRRGIPIGNLTSQFFANVMLDPLDHHVKERMQWPAYVRFADDFLLFANDKNSLHCALDELREFLVPYRLVLQPRKSVVLRVADGVPFLGWRLFPDHRRVRRSTGVRFQRRLAELQRDYAAGRIGREALTASVMSWIGHVKYGDTWGLRRKLFASVRFAHTRPERAA